MPDREFADLLIEARWLLPIAPADVVLEHHAVAVSAGRIRACGPAAELRQRFVAREHVVRASHALLPGLVNAHVRLTHTLLRAAPLCGPRRRWQEAIAALEARVSSADFVRDGTRLGMAEMLRAGITCFAELSPLPQEAARAVAAAQLRAAIALPIADAPTAWADGATAHLARAEALWDEYRTDARITLYFAPLARPTLSDATLARVRRVADELDARIALHPGELGVAAPAEPRPGASGSAAGAGVRDGASQGRGSYGSPPLQRLAAQGLLRPGFIAIGAAGAGPELELLRRHGAALVACPQAELRLGAVPAPLPAMPDDRGGLGTDSAAAAGSLDMLAEARMAALLGGLDAGAALRMATLAGATVLGLAAHIGTLEAGKAADLACIDLTGAGEPAAARVPEAIVFGATRAQVSDVWVGGRSALREGRLLAFDEAELGALPRIWAQRLGIEAAA